MPGIYTHLLQYDSIVVLVLVAGLPSTPIFKKIRNIGTIF